MLERAIALAKAGDIAEARILLRQIVVQVPDDARAWGWLAYCAETVSERRRALEYALIIAPDHDDFRRALEELGEEKPVREKLLSAQRF